MPDQSQAGPQWKDFQPLPGAQGTAASVAWKDFQPLQASQPTPKTPPSTAVGAINMATGAQQLQSVPDIAELNAQDVASGQASVAGRILNVFHPFNKAQASGDIQQAVTTPVVSLDAAASTQWKDFHPISTGLMQAGSGLTSPMNVMLGEAIGASNPTVQKLAAEGFSIQMLMDAQKSQPGIQDALQRGDYNEAKRLTTLAGVNVGLGVMGIAHSVGKTPGSEAVIKPPPTVLDYDRDYSANVAVKPPKAPQSETAKTTAKPSPAVALPPEMVTPAGRVASPKVQDLSTKAAMTPEAEAFATSQQITTDKAVLAKSTAPPEEKAQLQERIDQNTQRLAELRPPTDPTGSVPAPASEAPRGLSVRYGALPQGAEPVTYYDKMTQHSRDFEAAKAMPEGPEKTAAMDSLRQAVDKTKSDRAVNKLFDDYTDAALVQQIDPRTSSENPKTRALMVKELAARRAKDAPDSGKLPDIGSIQNALTRFSKAQDRPGKEGNPGVSGNAERARAGQDFAKIVRSHMTPDADPDARAAVTDHLEKVHQTITSTLAEAKRVMDAKPIVDEARAAISTMTTRAEKVTDAETGIDRTVFAGREGMTHGLREAWHIVMGDRLDVDMTVDDNGNAVPKFSRLSTKRGREAVTPEQLAAFENNTQARIEKLSSEADFALRDEGREGFNQKLAEIQSLVEAREAVTGIRNVYKGKGATVVEDGVPKAPGVIPTGNRDFWNTFFGKPKGYKASGVVPSGPEDARYQNRVKQLEGVSELARRGAESLRKFDSEGASNAPEVPKVSVAAKAPGKVRAPSAVEAVEKVRPAAWTPPEKPEEIPGKAWIKSYGDSKTEYTWKSVDVPKQETTPLKGMSSEQWEAYKKDRRGELGAVPIPQAVHDLGDEVKAIATKWKATASEVSTSLRNTFAPTAGVSRDTMETLDAYKGGEEKDKFQAAATLDSYSRHIAKLNDTDRLEVMSKIMRGDLQDTPELRQFAEDVRWMDDKDAVKLNEALNKRGDTTGQDILNIIKNHYKVTWKVPPGHDEVNYNTWAASRRPMPGSKGMLKMRVYDDILDGMDPAKTGGKPGIPITTNPIEMFKLAHADSARFVHAMNYFADARDSGRGIFVRTGEKLSPGQSFIPKEFEVYFPAASGEGLVRAGQWSMPEDEVRLMSNYLSADHIRNNILGRTVMDYKNIATGIKLWGPFHAASMIGKSIAMDVARGTTEVANLGVRSGNTDGIIQGLTTMLKSVTAPVTAFREGQQFKDMARFRSVAQSWLRSADGQALLAKFPNAPDMLPRMMNAGARLDVGEEYKIDIRKAFDNTVAKIRPDFDQKNRLTGLYHIGKAGVQGALIPLEAPLQGMFNKYIPMLKLGMLARQMATNDQMYSERLISGEMTQYESDRQAVSHVDNVLGQFNMSNLWQKRTTTSALQLLYNSVGWRMGTTKELGEGLGGQVREFGQAVTKGRLPMLNPKAAYWLGEAAVAVTVGALLHRAMTGKNPTTFTDMLHPQTGEVDQRGKPIRLNTPFYISNDVPQLVDNGLKGPFQYATSGLSSPIQGALEQYRNKSFSGQIIRDPNDTPFQQAVSSVRAAIPTPIAVQTYQRLAGSGSKARYASALGLSTARFDMDMTPAEKEASAAVSSERGSTPKTATQMGKYAAEDKIFSMIKNNSPELSKTLTEAVKSGTLSDDEADSLLEKSQTTFLEKDVRSLSPEAALRVWKLASPQERQTLFDVMADKADSLEKLAPARRDKLMKEYGKYFTGR